VKVVFMGTPEFAAVSLNALLISSHEVVGVVSQPDRRSGRRGKPAPPPVAAIALERNLPLVQPASLSEGDFPGWMRALEPEIAVVVAFGHILRREVLELPLRGCLNVHASLLPRWRGASPIQAAILAGDRETGVGVMQMDEGLDTGSVLHQVSVPIAADDTAETLHDTLAELGASALLHALGALERDEAVPVPQSPEGVTYAGRLRKEDGRLDWDGSATELSRHIRALHPWPGTQTGWIDTGRDQEGLKLHPPVRVSGEAGSRTESPGTVVGADAGGVQVACGDGSVLTIERLQAPGRRALDAREFLAGHPLGVGSRLG
jgi:methionyl-tRNA formyltransferase